MGKPLLPSPVSPPQHKQLRSLPPPSRCPARAHKRLRSSFLLTGPVWEASWYENTASSHHPPGDPLPQTAGLQREDFEAGTGAVVNTTLERKRINTQSDPLVHLAKHPFSSLKTKSYKNVITVGQAERYSSPGYSPNPQPEPVLVSCY